MHIVLDTFTALEFWLSDLASSEPCYAKSLPYLTSFENTSCGEVSQLVGHHDGASGTIELLVERKELRRKTDIVTCNAWGSRPLPPLSVCEIGTGIYAVSPELCVVRLAERVSREELMRIMADLMGVYCLSSTNRINLTQREPLMTRASLARYLENAQGIRGAKSVQRLMPWIPERSASPRETSMDLMLAAPSIIGGMGIPGFEANKRFDPKGDAALLTQKEFLVADVAYDMPDGPLLEYNSIKHHDTPEQLEYDFEKITALGKMGYTVIPISTRQFSDFDTFLAVASNVKERLGVHDSGKEATNKRRRELHTELLHIEARDRASRSLMETARWQFLEPRLGVD